MEKTYQSVDLPPRQWDAFRQAATPVRIQSPEDLEVEVNHFLRLWYARTEWVEQQVELDTGGGTVRYPLFCHKGFCAYDTHERPIGEATALKDRYSIPDLAKLLIPRLDGEWTMPAATDVPLTDDGKLADPAMLIAWRAYCGGAGTLR